MNSFLVVVVLSISLQCSFADLLSQIEASLVKTNQQLKSIGEEWEIEKYPLFLKSVHMHKSAWLDMKIRFMKSIVGADIIHSKKTPVDGLSDQFVISFTGSSVAAGHDSRFDQSYPIVTGTWMQPAFEAAGLNLTVRNVAMGNNPCMPYDPCVGTIAGYDADMVHWEQSYNCFDTANYEQFARQATLLPKKPIVVYSDSNTAHWAEKDCKPPLPQSAEDKALLKLLHDSDSGVVAGGPDPIEQLVSETNKDLQKRLFGMIKPILAAYGATPIQAFGHISHEPYACQGPYIKEWMKGAVSWHPSVVGHRLRAAHHAFFWLLGFREALRSLKTLVKEGVAHDTIIKDLDTTVAHWTQKHSFPSKPVGGGPVHVPDYAQCYTDMVPRAEMDRSISSTIVGGTFKAGTLETSSFNKQAWGTIVQEMVNQRGAIAKGISKGQQDFKFMLYGEQEAGPLSMLLNMNPRGAAGKAYICECIGNWGKMPTGFCHFDECGPGVFVTKLEGTRPIEEIRPFEFKEENAKAVAFTHDKKMDTCYELQHDFEKAQYVLTIVPKNVSRVSIIYLVTP